MNVYARLSVFVVILRLSTCDSYGKSSSLCHAISNSKQTIHDWYAFSGIPKCSDVKMKPKLVHLFLCCAILRTIWRLVTSTRLYGVKRS